MLFGISLLTWKLKTEKSKQDLKSEIMKKALLLLLGMMSFVSVNANDISSTSTKRTTIGYRYDDAVTFIEKGVEFHVFLNGNFEFDTPNRVYYNSNNRRNRYNDIRINRDYEGRIKRIGTNYIRYDYRGNVTRIGNVRIYYRRGFVKRVGGLKVSYNTWGDPYFYGNVHRDYYDSDIHFSINLGAVFNYNDHYFSNYSFKNNYRKYREDKHYYYYKVKPNGKVGKRGKLIKRRKAGVTKQRNNKYTKREIAPNRKSSVKRKNHTKRNSTPKRVKVTKKKIKRRTPKISVKKEANKRKVDKKQQRKRRS
jgi:hypothetical protein